MFLKDAIGSRYVTDGNRRDVERLLETPGVYDLNDCLITKEISEIVTRCPDRFIDTGDPVRNGILLRNQRSEENRGKYASAGIPDFQVGQLLQYLSLFNNETVYEVNAESQLSYAAYVYVFRPETMLTFGYLTRKMGLYLMRHLYNNSTKKLAEVVQSGTPLVYYYDKYVDDVTAEVKGDVLSVSNGEYRSLSDAVAISPILPKAIGTEYINQNPSYKEFWVSIVKSLQAPVHEVLTLYDFLVEGARYD